MQSRIPKSAAYVSDVRKRVQVAKYPVSVPQRRLARRLLEPRLF